MTTKSRHDRSIGGPCGRGSCCWSHGGCGSWPTGPWAATPWEWWTDSWRAGSGASGRGASGSEAHSISSWTLRGCRPIWFGPYNSCRSSDGGGERGALVGAGLEFDGERNVELPARNVERGGEGGGGNENRGDVGVSGGNENRGGVGVASDRCAWGSKRSHHPRPLFQQPLFQLAMSVIGVWCV